MCQVLMIVARYCRVTVTVLESMPFWNSISRTSVSGSTPASLTLEQFYKPVAKSLPLRSLRLERKLDAKYLSWLDVRHIRNLIKSFR